MSPGVFVYRDSAVADESGTCLCRSCFESGRKVELERDESMVAVRHVCPDCGASYLERKKPLTGLAMSPWG